MLRNMTIAGRMTLFILISAGCNGSWGGATNVSESGGNPAAVDVTDPLPATNRFLRLRVTHP